MGAQLSQIGVWGVSETVPSQGGPQTCESPHKKKQKEMNHELLDV